MVLDDTADDRQYKTGAAFLRGKVWQEELLFQFRRDSVAAIGDHNFDNIPAAQESSRNLNLAHESILHGFSGVIHEVGNRPFHSLGISHHSRQIGTEQSAHLDSVQAPIEHPESTFDDAVDV